jgi:hypothetical protein
MTIQGVLGLGAQASLLVLLLACGIQVPGKKHDIVHVRGATTKLHDSSNEQFQPYIEKFEFHGRREFNDPKFKVGDIPINFGDTTNPDYDGVCLVYSDETKEIIIRKSWWDRAHPLQREMMVFHELGHCRLGRTHEEETVPVGERPLKVSLMNPVIPDSTTYESAREGYISELFTYSTNRLMSLFGVSEASSD